MTTLDPRYQTLNSDTNLDSDTRSQGHLDLSQNDWSRRQPQRRCGSGRNFHNKAKKINDNEYKECITEEIKRDFSTLVISRNRVVYCTTLSKDEENETKSQILNNSGQINLDNTNENHFDMLTAPATMISIVKNNRNGRKSSSTATSRQSIFQLDSELEYSEYHGVDSLTTTDFDNHHNKCNNDRDFSNDGSIAIECTTGKESLSITDGYNERNYSIIANLNQTLTTVDSMTHLRSNAVLNDTNYLDTILQLLQKHVSSFETDCSMMNNYNPNNTVTSSNETTNVPDLPDLPDLHQV